MSIYTQKQLFYQTRAATLDKQNRDKHVCKANSYKSDIQLDRRIYMEQAELEKRQTDSDKETDRETETETKWERQTDTPRQRDEHTKIDDDKEGNGEKVRK